MGHWAFTVIGFNTVRPLGWVIWSSSGQLGQLLSSGSVFWVSLGRPIVITCSSLGHFVRQLSGQ